MAIENEQTQEQSTESAPEPALSFAAEQAINEPPADESPPDEPAAEQAAAPQASVNGDDGATQATPDAGAADPADQAASDPAAEHLAALAALEGRNVAPPQAQQSGFTPDALAKAVAQAVENSPANKLIAEALQGVNRQRMQAQRPNPPGNDGTAADWAMYSAALAEYERQNALGGVNSQIAPLVQKMQALERYMHQQYEAQRVQQYNSTIDTALGALAQRPTNAWLRDGEHGATRMAVVKAIYQQAGGRMTLDQVVDSVARTFGVAPPTPQQVAQTARTQNTAALKAQRERVASKPVMPSRGGKAAAPTGRSLEEKYRKSGTWDSLTPEMQEYYRVRDRRAMSH